MFEPQERDSGVVAPIMVAPFQPPRNETIAPGKDQWLMSPAERLGLIGAARAKHEKCLADAVYFEARGEPVRGQMAVAQVVINRDRAKSAKEAIRGDRLRQKGTNLQHYK